MVDTETRENSEQDFEAYRSTNKSVSEFKYLGYLLILFSYLLN